MQTGTPLPRPWRILALVMWCVLLAVVVYLSLLPKLELPGGFHLDKILHLGGYGALAALPFAGFVRPRLIWTAVLAMAPLGIGLEIAQDYVPGRFMETGDIVANLAGVGLGSLLAPPVLRRIRPLFGD